ncbi:MAG TPA: Ig-like domain repeat protein [Granulicella sp.]|nr:Ig-like domain repeat protein [Granulicella sp.]
MTGQAYTIFLVSRWIAGSRLRGGPCIGGRRWLGAARGLFVAMVLGVCAAAGAQTVQAVTVPLARPAGVAFDVAGNLYIAETNNQEIRKVDATGVMTTVAGTGVQGFGGDGGPAALALLDSPSGVAVDAAGNIYIADAHNQRIREIAAATGVITTIAGSGAAGFAGDGGPATAAQLSLPTAVVVDAAGDVFFSDTGNHRVRKVVAAGAQAGTIRTVAGTGVQGFAGDGGSATAAAMDSPDGLAVDGAGRLYLADTHNQRIRMVDPTTGLITTVVGSGVVGDGGDGAVAATAALALPRGVTVDASGNLYFADTNNQRIRRVDAATGVISTVAGSGVQGFSGDGGPALAATLDSPRATTLAPATIGGLGALTLADTGNDRVRQVGGAGVLQTMAGLGGTAAETLTLAGPAVIAYGSGSVSAALGSTTAATGQVVFLDVAGASPVPVATVPLGNNVAVLETNGLSAGLHSLLATYGGDAAHASAESAVLSIRIAPEQVVASPGAVNVLYGAPIPVLMGTVTGFLVQDEGQVGVVFSTTATLGSAVGSYAVSAALTGPAAGNYTLSLGPGGGVTINQAPATAVLSGTVSGLALGAQTTLTAQVRSSTTGVPTGTVVLLDGGTLFQSTALSASGIGVFNVSFATPGAQDLTAVYMGNAEFLPVASPVVVATVVAASAPSAPASPVVETDFTLASSGATAQTVEAGTVATYGFTVTEQGAGLPSQVALSVTGLPTGAVASFGPAYIPPGVLSSAVTLTIQTPNAALHGAEPLRRKWPPVLLAGLWVPWLVWRRLGGRSVGRFIGRSNGRRGRRRLGEVWLGGLSLGVFGLMGLMGLSGCGSRVVLYGDTGQAASQSYVIIVTGTGTSNSGAVLTHTAVVTLVVE